MHFGTYSPAYLCYYFIRVRGFFRSNGIYFLNTSKIPTCLPVLIYRYSRTVATWRRGWTKACTRSPRAKYFNYGYHRIPWVAFISMKYSLMQINRLTLTTYPRRAAENARVPMCPVWEPSLFYSQMVLLFLHCLQRPTVFSDLTWPNKKKIRTKGCFLHILNYWVVFKFRTRFDHRSPSFFVRQTWKNCECW